MDGAVDFAEHDDAVLVEEAEDRGDGCGGLWRLLGEGGGGEEEEGGGERWAHLSRILHSIGGRGVIGLDRDD